MAEVREFNEADYLLRKKVECPCCGNMVETLQLKTGKTRRLEPDLDLRPRCRELDTLKYGVISCPNCGYTALRNLFELLTSAQRKLLRENMCNKFHSVERPSTDIYTYQMAIEMHKLSLVNTMAKRGRASERAYTCLLIAWLDRGAREELEKQQEREPNDRNRVFISMFQGEEDKFLKEAYQGFAEALANETPPFCSLDLSTVSYLVSCLAYQLGDLDTARREISKLIVDRSCGRNMKEKARNLKELILEESEKNKGE